MYKDELLLRRFIREALEEGDGWENPDVVVAKAEILVDDQDEDEDEEEYDDDDPRSEVEKMSMQQTNLNKRDNYSSANSSLASMKPGAPGGGGSGAQTGRSLPGTSAAPRSRSYSAGY